MGMETTYPQKGVGVVHLKGVRVRPLKRAGGVLPDAVQALASR